MRLRGAKATRNPAELKICAGKTGQEARRIRRQQRTTGWAPVIAHVFYDGELRMSTALSKRLVSRNRLELRRLSAGRE